MTRDEFANKMKLYHNKLKETFGGNNVRVAVVQTNLDWSRNRLFLIKSSTTCNGKVEDTAIIIRTHLKHSGKDGDIWGVTSFYGYPNMTIDKEREIVTTAGELLEKTVLGGFVICETGSVKVNIRNTKNLTDIFGQKISHVV